MLRKSLCWTFAVTAIIVIWDLGLEVQEADAVQVVSSDLFYNYYMGPAGGGVVGAQLYPCPRPTPPRVGHVYYTYQPLMPHEFLYKHHRSYYRIRSNGGCTMTNVLWW